MTKNIRFFLVSVLLSLPLWFGANISSQELVDIFLWRELTTNPQILTAQAAQIDLEKQLVAIRPTLHKDVQEPTIQARAAFSLFYSKDGKQEVLFQQSAQNPYPIASITKLMTVLVALENYPLRSEISITPNVLHEEGDIANFQDGEVFFMRDLIYSMLIESSNDAALTLAEIMGEELFVKAMNQWAIELQLEDTFFANPSGLDLQGFKEKPSNYSSAQDLARLSIFLLDNHPEIFDVLSQQAFALRDTDNTLHHIMTSTNILLSDPDFEGKTIGGKTGWTPLAQGTLLHVLSSPREKGYIITVVLGSEDRFGETKSLIDWVHNSYTW